MEGPTHYEYSFMINCCLGTSCSYSILGRLFNVGSTQHKYSCWLYHWIDTSCSNCFVEELFKVGSTHHEYSCVIYCWLASSCLFSFLERSLMAGPPNHVINMYYTAVLPPHVSTVVRSWHSWQGLRNSTTGQARSHQDYWSQKRKFLCYQPTWKWKELTLLSTLPILNKKISGVYYTYYATLLRNFWMLEKTLLRN